MQNLRDYLSWRQVDCEDSSRKKIYGHMPTIHTGHVNNLYNTTFWAMVQTGNMDATRAEEELKGTGASNKHEILFSEYKINYNKELDVFKKGSVVYRDYDLKDHLSTTKGSLNVPRVSGKAKSKITMEHVDLIKDEFWEARPWLFAKIQEKRRIESQ
ncbi:tRNA-His guanylyltransferase [Toensbergia leucococca]|nr:tRNA-His guanylyltransferase [Toensbergia leucococca]